MKVIIAGTRTLNAERAYYAIEHAMGQWIVKHGRPDEIVTGTPLNQTDRFYLKHKGLKGLLGVDRAAVIWAEEQNYPLRIFPASWAEYGKAAGPIRNREMAEYADALLALWDGRSRGTKNMIEEAQKHRLSVSVYPIRTVDDATD